jgi:hypothetical protein
MKSMQIVLSRIADEKKLQPYLHAPQPDHHRDDPHRVHTAGLVQYLEVGED